LFARRSGRDFVVRMEDLDRDRVVAGSAERQLADLAAIGLGWDGEVVTQSSRLGVYDAALGQLTEAGLTYPCYCTRREIREAASAPQGPPESRGGYPGTCRSLTRADRRRFVAEGRPPALRLRSGVRTLTIVDQLHGEVSGPVDDVVLRRNDGLAAYNLAVVVDDADQGIDQVVRGDDLLATTPAQAHVGDLLGLRRIAYVHVPLAVNAQGQRLAKRDGAATLAALASLGVSPAQVLTRLGHSLGLCEDGEPVAADQLLDRFDPSQLSRSPWIVQGF
jgi:glutamyl-tRNA synthetase